MKFLAVKYHVKVSSGLTSNCAVFVNEASKSVDIATELRQHEAAIIWSICRSISLHSKVICILRSAASIWQFLHLLSLQVDASDRYKRVSHGRIFHRRYLTGSVPQEVPYRRVSFKMLCNYPIDDYLIGKYPSTAYSILGYISSSFPVSGFSYRWGTYWQCELSCEICFEEVISNEQPSGGHRKARCALHGHAPTSGIPSSL